MDKKLAVIDYRMGNICSVLKSLDKLKINYIFTNSPEEIRAASHILLPGVGHYENGVRNIDQLNLRSLLIEESKVKPLLGICLGMQLLFNGSAEAPGAQGLGLINGHFEKFNIKNKVPHMGWNEIYGDKLPVIFKDLPQKSNFYFVHSYHAVLAEQLAHALTDYEITFVSAVQKNMIFGTQFHPEKSQKNGLSVLKSFMEVSANA